MLFSFDSTRYFDGEVAEFHTCNYVTRLMEQLLGPAAAATTMRTLGAGRCEEQRAEDGRSVDAMPYEHYREYAGGDDTRREQHGWAEEFFAARPIGRHVAVCTVGEVPPFLSPYQRGDMGIPLNSASIRGSGQLYDTGSYSSVREFMALLDGGRRDRQTADRMLRRRALPGTELVITVHVEPGTSISLVHKEADDGPWRRDSPLAPPGGDYGGRTWSATVLINGDGSYDITADDVGAQPVRGLDGARVALTATPTRSLSGEGEGFLLLDDMLDMMGEHGAMATPKSSTRCRKTP